MSPLFMRPASTHHVEYWLFSVSHATMEHSEGCGCGLHMIWFSTCDICFITGIRLSGPAVSAHSVVLQEGAVGVIVCDYGLHRTQLLWQL